MSDTTANPRPNPMLGLLRTPAVKVGLILGLLLLMQIPLYMVSSLIDERQQRQEEVLGDFQRGWGPEQSVGGPVLVVPYEYGATTLRPGIAPERGWLRIAPSRAQVVATLQPETRRRGLFHAVVYTASVDVSGAFTLPAPDLKGPPDTVIEWAKARVVVGASDLGSLPADTQMEWNGASLPFSIADGKGGCGLDLLSVPAGFSAAPAPGVVIPFKTALTLRGTQALRLLPMGRQVHMQMSAPWATPSFVDALPSDYDLSPAGFTARWDTAGRVSTAGWQQRSGPEPSCNTVSDGYLDAGGAVGVKLQEAVPTYLMVSRAAKYGVLFLVLTFLTLFLLEALSGVRIHLVQYGLVGLSVSLFALLLISIAEPLGFGAAYAISTAAVMAQASLYTLSVVRRARLAAVFAGVLGALFAFLYVVLSLDSYALLAGTVALFTILSVIMVATRRVNWGGAAA